MQFLSQQLSNYFYKQHFHKERQDEIGKMMTASTILSKLHPYIAQKSNTNMLTTPNTFSGIGFTG